MFQAKPGFMFPAIFVALLVASAPALGERGVAVTFENKTGNRLDIEYYGKGDGHFSSLSATVEANSTKRITGKESTLSRWDIVGKVYITDRSVFPFRSKNLFCFAGRNPSIGYPLFAVSDDTQKQDDGQNAWKVCKNPNWLTGGDDGKKYSTDESATFSQSSISGSVKRNDDSDEEKEFVLTIDSIK